MDIAPLLPKLLIVTLRFLKLFQQTGKISRFNTYTEHVGFQLKKKRFQHFQSSFGGNDNQAFRLIVAISWNLNFKATFPATHLFHL